MKGKVGNIMNLLFMLADSNMPLVDGHVKVDNMELLLGQICMNRIEGLAYTNFRKCNNMLAPKEFRNTLSNLWKANMEKNEIYLQDLQYVGKVLSVFDGRYAFLKGAFLISQVYEKGCRTSNDFDILVQEKDLNKIQTILIDNGFVQGRAKDGGGVIPASRKEILLSRMNYGETVPFVKYVDEHNIVVDLNISVDYKPEKGKSIVELLLENCSNINVNGYSIITLSLESFIIHLCCHLYKEATTMYWVKNHRDLQLYKFCDINVFLHKYMNDNFVRVLIDLIKEYEMCKECYYTFYNSAEIFPELRKLAGFNELLKAIEPKDLKFMKEIVDPLGGKIYSHSMSFIEWFENKNRYETLLQNNEEKLQ